MSPAARRAAASQDYRNRPAYPVAEAARYLKIPVATLRTWVAGRDYQTSAGARRWQALIRPAGKTPALLSFWNLIEAHVLWGLRTDHSVSIQAVRKALVYAQQELGIDRLLLRRELCTEGGSIFLERYGELIQLSASGQIALRQIFANHLQRVEWDEWKFPVRLYPFGAADGDQTPAIAIDPAIAFGRPVILQRGIRTEILAERIDIGESIDEVAADYDMTTGEVEAAILYEHSA